MAIRSPPLLPCVNLKARGQSREVVNYSSSVRVFEGSREITPLFPVWLMSLLRRKAGKTAGTGYAITFMNLTLKMRLPSASQRAFWYWAPVTAAQTMAASHPSPVPPQPAPQLTPWHMVAPKRKTGRVWANHIGKEIYSSQISYQPSHSIFSEQRGYIRRASSPWKNVGNKCTPKI